MGLNSFVFLFFSLKNITQNLGYRISIRELFLMIIRLLSEKNYLKKYYLILFDSYLILSKSNLAK